MFAGIEVLEYLEEVISSEALKLKHYINRYIDVLVKLNFSISNNMKALLGHLDWGLGTKGPPNDPVDKTFLGLCFVSNVFK